MEKEFNALNAMEEKVNGKPMWEYTWAELCAMYGVEEEPAAKEPVAEEPAIEEEEEQEVEENFCPITKYNYFVGSYGYFKKCRTDTITNKEPDFVSGNKPAKKAEFWFTQNGLYRRSMYWGGMHNSPCKWGLLPIAEKGEHAPAIVKARRETVFLDEPVLGFVKWSDLKWSVKPTRGETIEKGLRLKEKLKENPDNMGLQFKLKKVKELLQLFDKGYIW